MRPLDFPPQFNLSDHLLDARVREGRGNTIAVISSSVFGERTFEKSWTYRDVTELAHRAASVLQASGVRPGDRVLIALPDSIAFVAALFGTLKAGAIAAMANPEAPVADLHDLLTLTGARIVITTSDIASGLEMMARPAPSFFVVGGNWEAALQDAAPVFTGVETGPDDVAMWLFTSGSTGKPRAAIHRHRDFAAHVECYARQVLDLRSSDVTLSVPRLHFPYATGMNLMFPFAVGAAAVLFSERPTPERVFAYIKRFSPTVFTTVPTMTAKMLALPAEQRPARLPTLRLAVSAGEALPSDLFHRWHQAYEVEMLDGIGSAEMFHIYVSNRRGDARPDCTGRPVPGYDVRIVRDDGSDADDDEIGALWVRGPTAALGYHGDEAATRAVFRDDGWVVTGDVFRRDHEGHFHYEGRADDLMKVGGLYVSPLEVETVLRQHPAVADCAVVGTQDADGLVKPRAYVVVREGKPTRPDVENSLPTFARKYLAAYKVPREFVVVPDLPRNDRGKVLRRVLRERG